MFICKISIQIGNYYLNYVHQCTVESSWKNLTDTCKIILPSNIKPNNNRSWNSNFLRNTLKIGDKVTVKAGYNEAKHIVFDGYLTKIGAKVPLELECEDAMWLLKQSNINDSLPNTSLKSIIQRYFYKYSVKSIDMNLGNFIIQNASKAKILESLKEQFGIYSFFRKGTLIIGLVYEANNAQNHEFIVPVYDKNTKQDNIMIENNLEYKRKEDVKIKVKAISNLSNGQKIIIELGDKDGEQRTLNFFNINEKDLKMIAEREMKRISYDGYQGYFTTFFPVNSQNQLVYHGDIVNLKAVDNDRSGRYFVDKVEYEIGVTGFKQKIYLGPKA